MFVDLGPFYRIEVDRDDAGCGNVIDGQGGQLAGQIGERWGYG